MEACLWLGIGLVFKRMPDFGCIGKDLLYGRLSCETILNNIFSLHGVSGEVFFTKLSPV